VILHIEDTDDNIEPSLKNFSSSVLSLKTLCRAVIRNRVGFTDEEVIALPNLPTELRDFLLYASCPLRKRLQEEKDNQELPAGAQRLYYQRVACTRGCKAISESLASTYFVFASFS
jgi:hypothetical protein